MGGLLLSAPHPLCVCMQDIGARDGKYYAVNVPLKDGIDDGSFIRMFRAVSHSLALAQGVTDS